ncbi:MAG TPA: gluconokinase, GntK/IdnK-type [Lichenihabitans sp.]|nr:gluconokinase, GntK/IdnK-type [Lichenihabitans sp.]
MPDPDPMPVRHAIVVMGVSGSGKSSCGARLAAVLGIDFVDGDDLHPTANVAKMSAGEALTDADRWPWLDRVAEALADRAAHPSGVAIACSALRRRYRDRLREGARVAAPIFLFLDITPEEARRRLGGRRGHYMPVSLVGSQFDTLERPAPDETDVATVEETEGVAETVDAAVAALGALA